MSSLIDEKRDQWERIKSEWSPLAMFLIEWASATTRDKRNRPIEPEKMGKVEIIKFPASK